MKGSSMKRSGEHENIRFSTQRLANSRAGRREAGKTNAELQGTESIEEEKTCLDADRFTNRDAGGVRGGCRPVAGGG